MIIITAPGRILRVEMLKFLKLILALTAAAAIPAMASAGEEPPASTDSVAAVTQPAAEQATEADSEPAADTTQADGEKPPASPGAAAGDAAAGDAAAVDESEPPRAFNLSWTSQGAGVEPPGKYTADISAGFPGLTVMFSLPVVRHLEVDPFFSINYWDKVTSSSPLVATNIGARLKLNGYDRNSLQIALVADLSFGVGLHPTNSFLMNLVFPQLLISGMVSEKVLVFGGMKVPVTLRVHPDFKLGLAFAGHVGAEFLVSEKLHVFIAAEAGPEICWTFRKDPGTGQEKTASSIGAWVATSVGIAVTF